ncbi:unnamed protein product [Moneuplotes crassus]|uniref:Uncharacterized protein n=1 Tax=Euplotes crassus TaxID=5936 RepID=A0AAD1X747_EUPCR|nr:unnamed protein product [Moneuplotes crassus]
METRASFFKNLHANFTMRNQRLDKLQDLSQCGDVADENVDERSLSRVSDRIVNRGSITNKLHNSFENIFNAPRNSLKQKQSYFKLTSANLIQVNLDCAEKGPVDPRPQGIVSKNYFPPMRVNNTMSRIGGSFSQRLSQSNGSYEADTELKQKKLLYFSQKLMKLKKKKLIKDLKLLSQKTSQNMKEKKQKREKKILRSKLSKNFKGKKFACILFLQKVFKIFLNRRTISRSPMMSITQLSGSSFLRAKYLAKAYLLGWKTRKLLNTNEVMNYRRNIKDLCDFYDSDPSQQRFINKAKHDYIEVVHKSLVNPSWWKTFIKSKSLQEKQERVQRIRERNKLLKEQRLDVSPSNRSQWDHPKSCKSGMTVAFDFSSTFSKPNEELAKISIKRQSEVIKHKKTNFLKRRSNLKYDPAKSIKDEKNRINKLVLSDKNSDEGEASGTNNFGIYTTATALKLSSRIQKEQASTKIVDTFKGYMDQNKASTNCHFQSLEYLKKVPKIDCWLNTKSEKTDQDMSTPKSTQEICFSNQRSLKTGKTKKGKINKNLGILKELAEFSKKHPIIGKTPEKSLKSQPISNDFKMKNKVDEFRLSGNSMGMASVKTSQILVKTNYVTSSPVSVKDATPYQTIRFKNESECLNFLLDHFKHNSHVGILNSEEKTCLKADKESFNQLASSKPLHKIYRLMNKKTSKCKKKLEADLGKYIDSLKKDYAAILQRKSRKTQIRGNQIYTGVAEEYQSNPSKEEQGSSVRKTPISLEYLIEAPKSSLRSSIKSTNKSLEQSQEKKYSLRFSVHTKFSKIYPRLKRGQPDRSATKESRKRNSLLSKLNSDK